MKHSIPADVYGFYTEFHKALDEVGYFTDPEPHKLIILGDLFDRGQEAVEVQRFILSLLEQDAVILVRGNHEDLYEEMITIDEGLPVRLHDADALAPARAGRKEAYGRAGRCRRSELLFTSESGAGGDREERGIPELLGSAVLRRQ